MTVVEVVRHGKAHSRKRWSGASDRERPLAEEGWHLARHLGAELVGRGPVGRIVSSPLLRCVQTVEPLAEACGVELATDERLAELRTLPLTENGSAWVASAWLGGRALAVIDELVDDPGQGRAVLCSHGDVIPALLALLVGRDGFELPDVRVRKGGRVSLTFEGRRCLGATTFEPAPKPSLV